MEANLVTDSASVQPSVDSLDSTDPQPAAQSGRRRLTCRPLATLCPPLAGAPFLVRQPSASQTPTTVVKIGFGPGKYHGI